eukprot:evm.model.NODE_21659_length_22718_cov_20.006426.9
MSLDSAARGFKEARATLMQAVLHQGNNSTEGTSIGKESIRREIASSNSGGGDGDRGGSSSSRRAFGAQQQQELDGYWAAKGWSTTLKRHPGYHTVKEKVLRQEVGAMNMTSNGKKDELVFRHQTFIKLAEAEADKVKLGHPTRRRGEVVREVEEKARVRFNYGGGRIGGGRHSMDLDSVAQHKCFDEMIRAMKRQQKEQKRKDQMASQGREGGEGRGGKGRGRPKDEDGLAHTEGEEVERKEDNSEQEVWEQDAIEVKKDISDESAAEAAASQSLATIDSGRVGHRCRRRDVDLDEVLRNGIDGGTEGDGAGRRVASLSPLQLQVGTGAVAGMSKEKKDDIEAEDIVILDTVTTTNSHNSNYLKRRVSGSIGKGDESGHHKRPHSLHTSLSAKGSLLSSTNLTTGWNCQSCTLTNTEPVRNCAACGFPRQVSTASKDSLKNVQEAQQTLFEKALKQQQQQRQLVSRAPMILEREAGESISQSGSISSGDSSTSADITVRLLRVDGAFRPSYHMLGKNSYETHEGHNMEVEENDRDSGKKALAEAEKTRTVDEHDTRQLYSPSY